MRLSAVTYRTATAVAFAATVSAQPTLAQPTELSDTWMIPEGGKPYDNWAKVLYYDTKKFFARCSWRKNHVSAAENFRFERRAMKATVLSAVLLTLASARVMPAEVT